VEPDEVIEMRVPADSRYMRLLRSMIAEVGTIAHLTECEIDDLKIAVCEACTNAIRHGYRGTLPIKPVIVRCQAADKQVEIEIRDEGKGFDPSVARELEHASLMREGGFGLLLIARLADHVTIDSVPERGTVVRLVKRAREHEMDEALAAH
jgi:serine/threonine-protein kinase RsbW